jgi:hypothetical protein
MNLFIFRWTSRDHRRAVPSTGWIIITAVHVGNGKKKPLARNKELDEEWLSTP